MDIKEWLRQASSSIKGSWNVTPNSADRFALLYAYLLSYGLNPVITSGFRSKEKQAELRARWDRGDRAGIRYQPAKVSRHSSGTALDITTRDPALAAQIAKALGLKAGYDYGDPVHFEA